MTAKFIKIETDDGLFIVNVNQILYIQRIDENEMMVFINRAPEKPLTLAVRAKSSQGQTILGTIQSFF